MYAYKEKTYDLLIIVSELTKNLTLKVLYVNLESKNLEKGQLLSCSIAENDNVKILGHYKWLRSDCPIVINVNCYPCRHAYSYKQSSTANLRILRISKSYQLSLDSSK